MEAKKRLDVSVALKGAFEIGLKNVFTILGASLLWGLTVWIPYLNIGTTIAFFTVLPVKLAKGEPFSPTDIFDARYRENMTNFFLILGLVNAAIGFALLLFIIPGIVMHFAWTLAAVLVINFGEKPIDAMNKSYQLTYGSKWPMFFSFLILGIILFIVSLILGLIVGGLTYVAVWLGAFVGFIVYVALTVVALSLYLGLFAQIIKSLILETSANPAPAAS